MRYVSAVIVVHDPNEGLGYIICGMFGSGVCTFLNRSSNAKVCVYSCIWCEWDDLVSAWLCFLYCEMLMVMRICVVQWLSTNAINIIMLRRKKHQNVFSAYAYQT